MFDEYLTDRAERTGDRFVPFDGRRLPEVCGRQEARGRCAVVSGQPRHHAARRRSRRRRDAETVYGLGNRKNDLFLHILHEDGVEVFEGSRRYLDAVSAAGLGVAVVSSSANTREVLDITGLARFVQDRVDGVTMRDESIAGKPAPDSFLRAAQLLGVPAEAAVFEDALSGVAAGRAGHFGRSSASTASAKQKRCATTAPTSSSPISRSCWSHDHRRGVPRRTVADP